ncbi:MAG: hypothetical protein M5U26_25735 [Planctomycetota bacterium]|nr:hypothetical protein [Planctomycetota bacterium]
MIRKWVWSHLLTTALALAAGFAAGRCHSQAPAPEESAAPVSPELLDVERVEPYRELARKLDALLANRNRNAEPQPVEAGGDSRPDWKTAGNQLSNVCGSIRDGNMRGASSQVRGYLGRTDQPAEQEFWEEVRGQLSAFEALREAALRERVSKALEEARAACLNAKHADDLMPAQESLRKAYALRNLAWDDKVHANWERLQNAQNFVGQMQRYLAARDGGYEAGAAQLLSSMLQGSSGELLSFKELHGLSRADDGEDWVKPMLGEATPETLNETVNAIVEQIALRPGGRSNQAGNLIYALNQISSAYSIIKSGRPGVGIGLLQNANYNRGLWVAETERLIHLVEREWILAVTGIASEQLSNAVLPVFALEKLANEAAEKREWDRALKLLTALADLRPSQSEQATDRLQACRAYLAGLRFEKAGELEEAARSFRDVLRFSGPYQPHDDAAAALKRLAAAARPPEKR